MGGCGRGVRDRDREDGDWVRSRDRDGERERGSSGSTAIIDAIATISNLPCAGSQVCRRAFSSHCINKLHLPCF